jgi:HEAT repeat protein
MTSITRSPTPERIRSLVEILETEDGMERQRARDELVTAGVAVVPLVAPLLGHPVARTRWEAAKTLATIADPACAPHLVAALQDKGADIRWLAAKGLARIGRPAFDPLLRELIHDADDPDLRHGVHHVLHDLRDAEARALIEPVWDSLNDGEPAASVTMAARRVLDALRE